MNKNAERNSKRQARRATAKAVAELGGKTSKVKGNIVITPKRLLKGYVKWNVAIQRAIKPLSQQWGICLKAVQDGRLEFTVR